MSKYHKQIRSESVDVYDVLVAFGVTNPAVQHAIKKLLAPGQRGYKDTIQDLTEARQSIDRAIEIQQEQIQHGKACGIEDGPAGEESDGWITWHGGECPVDPAQRVSYKLRCDAVDSAEAYRLRWRHRNDSGDIVAYMIVK